MEYSPAIKKNEWIPATNGNMLGERFKAKDHM